MNLCCRGPVAAGAYPLVVISHGTGSSRLLYRRLAAHLARHGFIVAMPEHPLSNRNHNTLAGSRSNLANRPGHIRLVAARSGRPRAAARQSARRVVPSGPRGLLVSNGDWARGGASRSRGSR
ncbi:MAG: hypothetical protein M3Y48_20590 [Actinomycetota bacterium]|nr:hypothetical protein [Actinomycetota bacterium]